MKKQGENYTTYKLNCSGNYMALAPVFDQYENIPGAAFNVNDCLAATVFGNTLVSGVAGFFYQGGCSNVMVINNNFGPATYVGVGYRGYGDFVNTGQIFNNTLNEGSTFHLQLIPANNFGWFLRGNSYINLASNSVAPSYDPVSPALHVSN